MDALYSVSLTLAVLACAASIVSSSVALARASEAEEAWSGAWSIGFASLGTFALFASFAVHWLWGHGSDNVAPMDLAGFLRAHPSFLVVAFALVVAEILFAVARARIARGGRSRSVS